MVVFNSDGETIIGRSSAADPIESEDSAGFSDFLADWLFIVAVLLGSAALAFWLVPIFNPAWEL